MFKLLDWCFISISILFGAFWYSSSPTEYPFTFLGMLPFIISLSSVFSRKSNTFISGALTFVSYLAIIYLLLDILFDFTSLPSWKIAATSLGGAAFASAGRFKTDVITSALTGFWTYVFITLFNSKNINFIFDLHNPILVEKLKIVGSMMLVASIYLAIQYLLLKKRNTKAKKIANTQNKRKASYSKNKNNFKAKENNFKTNENNKYNF
ncbi:hypothetical protein O0Q50_19865 [Priestia aryabhattai]|uniref:Uncharacterized protein n=1 Tax=Priestia aryabhattai TaxID=412384 RepID=A0AAX6ND64_PRIAR|nr:hypothetical protein [Priestia aryabhattai]MDU9693434.1 hypothetical protein [Priestia aryabhattai]